MDVLKQIVLLGQFFRDVREFDVSIFRAVDGFGGKNINVKASKSSTRTKDEAVGNQFEHLEGASFGNKIARVDDVITPVSNLCAVLSSLLVLSSQMALV